ncbi:MAG: hypothetical protein R2770_13515 [Acidimicrobiales bacterium]
MAEKGIARALDIMVDRFRNTVEQFALALRVRALKATTGRRERSRSCGARGQAGWPDSG